MQQPHPPIWIPSQGSRETIEWAAHPSRKYTYLQTFSPVDQLARFMAMYRSRREKYGYQASAAAARLGDADLCERHATRPRGAKRARTSRRSTTSSCSMPVEMLLPPGYLSLASMASVDDKIARRGRPRASSYDRGLVAQGMIICGGPDSVAQQLETYQKKVGFGKSSP